jgi:cysteine desulfuration protein SufE
MTPTLPPTVERVLTRFRAMDRETRMQALLAQARKLEPLPERFAALEREAFTVPECQTRVDLFPEVAPDGTLHFWADVNVRQSPTVAAVLSLIFAAVNDQPPETALALPDDFVRQLMDSIGLGAREAGLTAMLRRVQRHATEAIAARDGGVVAP